MLKKILYGMGGVVLLSIVFAAAAPTPVPVEIESVVQKSEEVASVQPEKTATSVTPAVAAKTQIPVTQPKTPTAPTQASSQTKSEPTSQYTYYSVTSVVDGDTIKVDVNGVVKTLRLIGMDTPETVDPRKPVQCFGKEASNKAKELLTGKRVRIEVDSTQGELDKYDRTLAYVYREDGLFYNKYMIEQGYAHEYTYNTPYKYQIDFKTAQKTAQANQMGLWSPNTCNGNTTSDSSAPGTTQSTGKFYTSSYYSSKYYYPEACDGWKSLSASNLKSFDSLEALLASYPTRTKSPQCQ